MVEHKILYRNIGRDRENHFDIYDSNNIGSPKKNLVLA
jgi:hypothetical protein